MLQRDITSSDEINRRYELIDLAELCSSSSEDIPEYENKAYFLRRYININNRFIEKKLDKAKSLYFSDKEKAFLNVYRTLKYLFESDKDVYSYALKANVKLDVQNLKYIRRSITDHIIRNLYLSKKIYHKSKDKRLEKLVHDFTTYLLKDFAQGSYDSLSNQ